MMKQIKHLLTMFNNDEKPGSEIGLTTAPIITITATNSLLIENKYTLVEYKEKVIVLKSDHYYITINGEHLQISFMYPNEMKLVGNITHVSFHH